MQEDLNKVDILLFWESAPTFGAGPRVYGQLSIPNVTFVPSQHGIYFFVVFLLLQNTFYLF